MTVQTSTNVASFLGNGVNTSFPIGFKFNSAADLVVHLTNSVTELTVTLTLNSDFSVTGAGDEDGGTIVLAVAPQATETLRVTRKVDLLQLIDLRNQGKFYAEIHEEAFDKLVMIDQQQQTEIGDANAAAASAVAIAESAETKADLAVEKAEQNLLDMQAQYDSFEQGASLYVIGEYAEGLVISAYNQVFRKDGEFYRADAGLSLPYELTGDWLTEASSFVSVGDATLRQDLRSWGLVSALSFGLTGSGSDETAGFTALEAAYSGGHVDLGGRIYTVTAVPQGNDYFNGAFKVGAEVYWLNASKREHPLANPVVHAKGIMVAEGKYRGLSTAAFHREGSGRLVLVYREALGHAPENNTPIYCAISDDMGDRFGLSTTDGVTSTIIAQQSNADIRNWASGEMGNGRLGILACRRDFVGGTYLASIFIYSDNDGDTWSTVNVPITTASWDSHSRIYPYPASVGGHDTLGWIVYAYTTDHGICAMKTVDNGASWTEVLDCVLPTSLDPASEAASLSEMSVARVGKQNKWVMVLRTNQEAAVSVSTDMVNWSSAKLIPAGTLNKMLANPPELTYADGKLWFWSFSRRGSKEIYNEYANALVVSEADPDEVFNSGGVSGWKQWRVVTALPFWPSGYMNHLSIRNRPYVVCTTGEDTAGSSTSRQAVITLLGPDPTVALGVRSVMRLIPKPNLYPVGDWRYFPLPGATSGAARVPFLPLTSFARNGGVTGASVGRFAGNKAQYKLRVRRDDGNTSTAAPNICIVLPKEDSYQLRNRFVTVSFDAAMASGFSAVGAQLVVRMRQTNDTSEAPVTSTSGSFPTGDTTVQSSSTGVTLSTRWQHFELMIGPFAADVEQAQLQIFWTPVGTALNDYFEIENLKIEEGKIATPFEVRPLAEVKAWADRWVRVFNMPTINGRQFRHMDPPMHRNPTVTLSRGTLVGAQQDYITVDDTGNNMATVTAVAVM